MAWAKTKCMASLDGETYLICNGLYKILPDLKYSRVGTGSWAKTTLMVGGEDGHLYLIEGGDGLYQVTKDGAWKKCGTGQWANCQGLAAAQGALWIVQGGTLYKVDYAGAWKTVS